MEDIFSKHLLSPIFQSTLNIMRIESVIASISIFIYSKSMNNGFLNRKSTKTINNQYYRSESDRSIKTLNQNIFWSIYINLYRKKFVIKNKLSILYRMGKSMHYPESPKVDTCILETFKNWTFTFWFDSGGICCFCLGHGEHI